MRQHRSRQLCLGCLAMAEQCIFPFTGLAALVTETEDKKFLYLHLKDRGGESYFEVSGKEYLLTSMSVRKCY